ncbi:MAG: hypothetical protein DBX55_01400 [Verrucomicrobia bacterium]|nr:MAG: hypothetical protein DBX55_01400 [Verrucomicrobiota bacterium]
MRAVSAAISGITPNAHVRGGAPIWINAPTSVPNSSAKPICENAGEKKRRNFRTKTEKLSGPKRAKRKELSNGKNNLPTRIKKTSKYFKSAIRKREKNSSFEA